MMGMVRRRIEADADAGEDGNGDHGNADAGVDEDDDHGDGDAFDAYAGKDEDGDDDESDSWGSDAFMSHFLLQQWGNVEQWPCFTKSAIDVKKRPMNNHQRVPLPPLLLQPSSKLSPRGEDGP